MQKTSCADNDSFYFLLCGMGIRVKGAVFTAVKCSLCTLASALLTANNFSYFLQKFHSQVGKNKVSLYSYEVIE